MAYIEKSRFTEEQIIGFLQQAEAGIPIKKLSRKHEFSDASFYSWRAKFGGMRVPDVMHLKELEKELESENAKLKKLLAELTRHRSTQGRPGVKAIRP